MAFSKESTFSKDNNFSLVKIGERKPVLETELNEMQEIQNHKRKELVKLLLADGVFKAVNMTYTGGVLTVSNTSVILNGEILTISSLTIPVVNGDSIYIDMWEEEVSYLDVIKKDGNQQSTEVVTNKLFDSRVNLETARRVQVKYTLSKTNTDPNHKYLKLGKIENSKFVQEVKVVSSSDDLLDVINQINAKMPEWDAKETSTGAQAKADQAKTDAIASAKSYTDTEVAKKVDKVAGKQLSTEDYTSAEKTKLAGIEAGATKYVHPATHPATMITQDANNRMVTDTQINDWSAKETTSGSQSKATTAETNAINFAKSFGLGVVAKDISGTDLNSLDVTGFYQGTNITNSPFTSTTRVYVINIKYSATYKTQLLFHITTNASMFTRTNNNGVWGSWTQIATQDWVKSFGLGGQAKTISNTDLNSLDETGFYYGTNLTNSPNTTHHYYVNNIKLGSTDRHQVLYRNSVGAYKEVYFRLQNNGTWTPWLQLETTADSQAKATTAETNAINFAKSYGLGVDAKLISDTNLNSLDGTGFYRGTNLGNAPTNEWYYIIHVKSDANAKYQIAVRVGNEKFFTRRQSAGAWSAWTEMETTAGAQAKADAVNTTQVNKIADNSKTNADALTTFTEGITTMKASIAGRGFPYQWGILSTFRTSEYGSQIFTVDSGTVYTRTWDPNGAVWRAWVTQETTTGAKTKADTAETNAINFAKGFGLGSISKLLSSIDLNTTDETGFYYASNCTNRPMAENGYLINQKNSTVYKSQIYITVSTNRIFNRGNNNGTWSAWTESATQEWVKSFGLGDNAGSIPNNNLDDIASTGMYIIASSTNAPISFGTVFHIRRNAEATQLVISTTGSIAMYMRRKVSGSWSAWTEMETTAGAQAKADAVQTNLNSHTSDKNNPHGVTKTQVGLSNVVNIGIATQAEAEAGTTDGKYMTPLKTKQAIEKLAPDEIIQQPTPPTGTKEGRLWLDTSDNTHQGTALEGVESHLIDNVKHTTQAEKNLIAGALQKTGGILTGRTVIKQDADGSDYTQSQLEVVTNNGSIPGISLHRGGFTAVSLFHKGNSMNDLLKVKQAGFADEYSILHTGNIKDLGVSRLETIAEIDFSQTPASSIDINDLSEYEHVEIAYGGLKHNHTATTMLYVYLNGEIIGSNYFATRLSASNISSASLMSASVGTGGAYSNGLIKLDSKGNNRVVYDAYFHGSYSAHSGETPFYFRGYLATIGETLLKKVTLKIENGQMNAGIIKVRGVRR